MTSSNFCLIGSAARVTVAAAAAAVSVGAPAVTTTTLTRKPMTRTAGSHTADQLAVRLLSCVKEQYNSVSHAYKRATKLNLSLWAFCVVCPSTATGGAAIAPPPSLTESSTPTPPPPPPQHQQQDGESESSGQATKGGLGIAAKIMAKYGYKVRRN